MTIKRENWNGKLRVVARDEKGRIQSWKKWGKKFTISRAKKLFATNQTFKERIFKQKLKNVVEVTDFSGVPKIPRASVNKGVTEKQYVVRATLISGKVISARSLSVPLSTPNKVIRDQAFESFYARLDGFVMGISESGDPNRGRKFFKDLKGFKLEEGLVYYVPKKKK